jgi:penicillin amidase
MVRDGLWDVEEKRRHPWLKRLGWALLALLLLAAVGIGAGGVWLEHAMRVSLPQMDGEIRLAGLSTPVTVRRDHHGIPHIEAANLDDLLVAQGYVMAQDRLWQMDMARRNAAGELAEILGRGFVAQDRIQRVLQIRATAERMAANLSEQDRRFYEDYARGVNLFIDTHQHTLPAEFRLLMYKPRRWAPVDSLMIGLGMVQLLDQHFEDKLSREKIEARIGPTLAADLYPTGSWRDHPPTAPIPDLTAPQQNIPDVPLDESQSSLHDVLAIRQIIDRVRGGCDLCQPGSNQWVVAGTHTESGKPLLANDMHLGHAIPNIWYQVDLKAGNLHVTGVDVPGAPFVVEGHNEHIAWGYTALYGDTQDIYVEKTNAQGEVQRSDGQWHALEHEQSRIHVRGSADVLVDIATTEHGAVISPLFPNDHRLLALKWTAYDPKSIGFPIYEINSASTWAAFRLALSKWWGPTQNIVYADDQGHIGYQAIGFMPMRPTGISGVPITDTQHEWQGYVPFEALPSTLDPPNGILATANARITPDGYPYPLTLEWASPYRNERIWHWLAAQDKFARADMIKLQTDIYSELDQELGQRFAYAIDHSSKNDARMREAADLLRSWDGVVGVNAAAANIVTAAKRAFWPALLSPHLGDDWPAYQWAESGFVEEELITHSPPQWLPRGFRNWDDFLASVVDQGLRDAQAPRDLTTWNYGKAHPVEVDHPLYRMLPYFKSWTGTGAQPQSGDGSTVKQVGRAFGPSQRLTVDWSDIDQSTENIVMGESGNPLSPYYRDQWRYWYTGTTYALPFTDQAVAAATQHTLRLVP